MLEEYSSRKFVDGSDHIERFYWGEQFHGYVMAAYLIKISQEMGIINDLDIKRKQDLLVILHSTTMSKYLNSFYKYELSNTSRTKINGEWKSMGWANLNYDSFNNKSESIKYSYLAGAYFRFGLSNRYRLTNGQRKAELISKLLTDVGCPDPSISIKKGIPSTVYVDFKPTVKLLDWFSRNPEMWAIEMVDSLIGTASSDEIDIYRCVISGLQRGTIEDCILSVPCVVSRLNNIFGDGDTYIPGLKSEWQEVLDDHNNRRIQFTCLKDLANDSILVQDIVKANDRDCWLTLTRIGFSNNKKHALALIAYRCKRDGYCGNRVAFFLEKETDSWKITHYTLKRE